MATSIDTIREELMALRKDVEFIKNVLIEDYDLSDSAVKALEEARKTPESDYIDL